MSADVVALVAGTILSVGALAFVLYPLFFATSEHERGSAGALPAPDDSAILALREIEFDRATGKLSEADYVELKQTYATRAVRELRAGQVGADTPAPADDIEARVREYRLTHRECSTCGVRPEADAVYCSTCGSYLAKVCGACGASITESGATFCSTCGAALSRSVGAVVAG